MLISPIWCALNLYPKEPKKKKEFQRIVTTAQERQAQVPHTAGALITVPPYKISKPNLITVPPLKIETIVCN